MLNFCNFFYFLKAKIIPPSDDNLNKILKFIERLQKSDSPLEKLENLLAAISAIFNSVNIIRSVKTIYSVRTFKMENNFFIKKPNKNWLKFLKFLHFYIKIFIFFLHKTKDFFMKKLNCFFFRQNIFDKLTKHIFSYNLLNRFFLNKYSFVKLTLKNFHFYPERIFFCKIVERWFSIFL